MSCPGLCGKCRGRAAADTFYSRVSLSPLTYQLQGRGEGRVVCRDPRDPQFASPGSAHLSFPIEAPTLGSSQPRKGDTVDPWLLCCPRGPAPLPRLCPVGALEQGFGFRISSRWRRGSTGSKGAGEAPNPSEPSAGGSPNQTL